MRVFTLSDFQWNPDAAASGNRVRALNGGHEIIAYEDGRWFLNDGGAQVAGGTLRTEHGTLKTLELAKKTAVCVYNLWRKS